MRSSSSSSSSLLIAALLCCGPAFADMPPPGSTTIWSEPVKGSEIPFAVVEAVIDAPPERVWQIVSRCNDYVKHMPRIAASKELKREGDGDAFTTTCQVTADLPFPLGDLTSVSKAVHGVERGPDGAGVKFTRRWTFLSGDYDLNEGSWTLLAVDDGKKTMMMDAIDPAALGLDMGSGPMAAASDDEDESDDSPKASPGLPSSVKKRKKKR